MMSDKDKLKNELRKSLMPEGSVTTDPGQVENMVEFIANAIVEDDVTIPSFESDIIQPNPISPENVEKTLETIHDELIRIEPIVSKEGETEELLKCIFAQCVRISGISPHMLAHDTQLKIK